MIKKLSFLMGSILVSQTAFANNNNVQSVIDAFTNCDNSFFYQLKNNVKSFDGIADVTIEDNFAYIPVKNVSSHEENSYIFEKPISYRGLEIVGYQNIYIETPFLGQYYYWGFIINGTTDQVKQSLKQLSWQQYNVVGYVANSQILDRQLKNKFWKDNPYSIDGVIPRQFTAEKMLNLEPINEKQVHLICSLQGDMTPETLYAIRPDMKRFDEEAKAERLARLEKIKQKKAQEKAEQEKQQNNMADEKPKDSNADTESSEEI